MTSSPGDIWYFPRGHGHVIETLGDKPCHFILVFDNGYFSEFGTFSITDWLGHAPKELLAKNFGASGVDLRQFSQEGGLFRQGQDSDRRRRPRRCRAGRRRRSPTNTVCFRRSPTKSSAAARVARRWFSVSDFHDHDRRRAGDGAGRASRIALASQCRRVAIHPKRRIQRHPVRVAGTLARREPRAQEM